MRNNNPSFKVEVRDKISKSMKGRIPKNVLRGDFSGEKNWLWKGGISPINKRIRQGLEYKEWRKKCFERDSYICQECGTKGNVIYLIVHHIKSFASYPKLRFLLSNGVTLCECCHSLTDNYKGRERKKI